MRTYVGQLYLYKGMYVTFGRSARLLSAAAKRTSPAFRRHRDQRCTRERHLLARPAPQRALYLHPHAVCLAAMVSAKSCLTYPAIHLLISFTSATGCTSPGPGRAVVQQ